MTWARRRQLLYLSGVGVFLLIVLGVPTYFVLDKPPSCFDGSHNQDELGVDCGGSCQLLCRFQVSAPTLLWSRAFPVAEGVVNVLAYMENPNQGAYTLDVPYRFQIFDNDNVLVAERRGRTYITSHGLTPIFEPQVFTGSLSVGRTFFEITGAPTWYRAGDLPRVDVEGEEVVPDDGARVEAWILNEEVFDITNIEVVAAIFDRNNNVMLASRTVVPLLPKRGRERVVFTWPRQFPDAVGRIDIVPRIPPQ